MIHSSFADLLIARNHDRGARAFSFGQLAFRSHSNLQLFQSSARDRAIEIGLIQGILNPSAPSTATVARFEKRARTASFRNGAGRNEGSALYDLRPERQQNR